MITIKQTPFEFQRGDIVTIQQGQHGGRRAIISLAANLREEPRREMMLGLRQDLPFPQYQARLVDGEDAGHELWFDADDLISGRVQPTGEQGSLEEIELRARALAEERGRQQEHERGERARALPHGQGFSVHPYDRPDAWTSLSVQRLDEHTAVLLTGDGWSGHGQRAVLKGPSELLDVVERLAEAIQAGSRS